METKNNIVVIGLLVLIIGLGIGYSLGANRGGYFAQNNKCGQGVAVNDHAMGGAMDDMMSGLEGKSGAALEEAFLDEMIVHHEGAVEMARELLAGTKRPELVKMANDIISAQTNEIEMMKQWQVEWFGN